MSHSKRCAFTIPAMEGSSSIGPTISKKRKFVHCSQFQFHSSHSEASVDSAGTVVSAEFCSDHSLRSCCSSSHVKELRSTPLDLKTKGFETVDSTSRDFKSFSLLSEFSGDSEESTMLPAQTVVAVNEDRKAETPPEAEIEEFFAMAEKYEEKRFTEKYNFDIVRDMPLEGRYQWVRLH